MPGHFSFKTWHIADSNSIWSFHSFRIFKAYDSDFAERCSAHSDEAIADISTALRGPRCFHGYLKSTHAAEILEIRLYGLVLYMGTSVSFPACFVLSAPQGSAQRRESSQSQLDGAGVDYTMVTGFGPEDKQISHRYSPAKNLLLMKRHLARGEIAVYLGHQKIWQMVLDRGISKALILEDDFRFVEGNAAVHVIATASQHLGQFDLIKLFDFRTRKPLTSMQEDGFELAIYRRPNSGLVGYLISADCCRKLLQRKQVFRPVDEELRYWFEKRIRIASIEPNPIADDGERLDGSILDRDREATRAKRSLLRSLYANLISGYVSIRCWLWSRQVLKTFNGGK